MARSDRGTNVYRLADRWFTECLSRDGSILTDGAAIWTDDYLDAFERAFIDNPIEGKGDWISVKLRDQLSGQPPSVLQLAAEMTLLMLAPLGQKTMSHEVKTNRVMEILGWAESEPRIDNPVSDWMSHLANTGTYFITNLWRALVVTYRWTRAIRDMDSERRNALRTDPTALDEFMSKQDPFNIEGQHWMLAHLLQPEAYEPIYSRSHKEKIVETFGGKIPTGVLGLDAQIRAIRAALEPEFGPGFNFYADTIKARWLPADPPAPTDFADQLAIVTASGAEPRRNIDRSITRPIDYSFARQHFDVELLAQVQAQTSDGGLYAWGALPGPKNREHYDELQVGASVLIYQSAIYTYVSRVLAKTRSDEFTRALWGSDAFGNTWELMYFLDAPTRIEVPARDVSEFLPASYRGFTLIGADRIQRIKETYGSVETFLQMRFLRATRDPLRDETERNVIREGLEAVLEGYGRARASEPFGSSHAMWGVFKSLANSLERSAPVRSRPSLKLDWSAGQGNWAKVPWISFLDSRETTSTQSGVYCVLLFRQDMSGAYLTLNQGVTEPRQRLGGRRGRGWLRERASELRERYPQLKASSFQLDDEIDLRADPGLGAEYESSTIAYKLYDVGRVPSDAIILEDLQSVLAVYDDFVTNGPDARPPTNAEAVAPIADLEAITSDFAGALRDAHLSFGQRHDDLVRSFVTSLATKRFVILTGLSGSGKTQLAMRFGEWLGSGQSHLEPVRPDWTGAEAVFGFEDALQEPLHGRRPWNVPRVLEFMLKAAADPQHPYLLILDEMNLAHVERYFADFLSGIESDSPVLPRLHRDEAGSWRLVSTSSEETHISLPRNLLVAGTVNVDETTYMFSPKVLDRANVFEFRVETDDLSTDFRRPVSCAPGSEGLVRGFLSIARDDQWHLEHPAPQQDEFGRYMREIHSILSSGGFEFGHRVFYEAVRFASMLADAGVANALEAVDLQLLQKVLPRLHGSRRRLEPTLCALGHYAFDLTIDDVASEGQRFDPVASPRAPARLPVAFEKIRRMTTILRANQFVSFSE